MYIHKYNLLSLCKVNRMCVFRAAHFMLDMLFQECSWCALPWGRLSLQLSAFTFQHNNHKCKPFPVHC